MSFQVTSTPRCTYASIHTRNDNRSPNTQQHQRLYSYRHVNQKHTDDERSLLKSVLSICIGGENIEWDTENSVNTVCELLGVGKTTVYRHRKGTNLTKPASRKRRSDALNQQPWWDHASAVMDTLWEENCDEVPDADDPAELHDFSDKANHRYDPLPDKPDVTQRVCVGMYGLELIYYIS